MIIAVTCGQTLKGHDPGMTIESKNAIKALSERVHQEGYALAYHHVFTGTGRRFVDVFESFGPLIGVFRNTSGGVDATAFHYTALLGGNDPAIMPWTEADKIVLSGGGHGVPFNELFEHLETMPIDTDVWAWLRSLDSNVDNFLATGTEFIEMLFGDSNQVSEQVSAYLIDPETRAATKI